ncbi:ABC transporter ATP-binding protein [Microbacterium sp. Marseille-Q6965]|uniref:ABC transporter ATP-binding protein n=1 Tax=Microbacterium sp. Marseille-Q6965 TaxID=2965072 RepID=UPI0021B74C59|nr:ABC transporter ATP-binding protein [Microbacterium sp. Marseille-Q6965]
MALHLKTQPTPAATTRAAADPAGPVIQLRNVAKRFRRADGTVANAIDGVTLDVAPGEFVVLLGPSGCGKTTLLRTIAGLERADEGEIDIHGRTVFDAQRGIEVPPERRNLSMIFQSYALWPHLTVFDNVAYPLRSRGQRLSKAEIAEKVNHVLQLVGVGELGKQYPGQMSGGQQQRVALARALVDGGDLVLFDEPLSNVDAKVRETLRRELLEMQRTLGFAAVYVTHDQHEAMELAHRVAVMGGGKVRQLDVPRRIYSEPASRYVANFIGTTNEFPATVRAVDGDALVLDTPAGQARGVAAAEGLAVGDEVVACFRPEYALLDTTSGEGNVWPGIVERVLFLGQTTETVVRLGPTSQRVRVTTLGEATHAEGDDITVYVSAERLRVLPVEDVVA